MKKISKYLAVFAASTFILNILVPGALAYTSTEISGNGSSSENFTTITKIEEKKVVQNNTAAVNNVVNATSSSGNNIVDGNTGGEVSLSTGDATTNVNLKTLANANLALFGNCDDCEGKKVEIVGNGAHSLNVVEGNFVIETSVCQDNFSSIDNQVNANAITGNNQISDNTGGDIKLNSGSATVNTNVVNEANLNWAQVGYTGGDNDWLSAKISNNGADTQNFINVLDNRLALVAQENFAWIDNRINANATTGQNHVLANTESYVWLNTGSATANVNVDNTTNFNLAEVEYCPAGEEVEIKGNGSDADEVVNLNRYDFLNIFQNGGNKNNSAYLNSLVNAVPFSGGNGLRGNTGPVEIPDPINVHTGPVTSNVNVVNQGNANVLDAEGDHLLPEVPNFSFTFDFGELWHFFR